jgi:hypothetical protein
MRETFYRLNSLQPKYLYVGDETWIEIKSEANRHMYVSEDMPYMGMKVIFVSNDKNHLNVA